MTMSTSPSQRDFNNKVIFERLKKDFDIYFNRDKYFGSLTDSGTKLGDLPMTSPSTSIMSPSTVVGGGPASTFGFNLSIMGTSPKRDPNMLTVIKKGTQIKLKSFLKMMHELGFISLKKSSNAEENLLTTLWKMLEGTNENSIKAENLLIALAAVMNVTTPEVLVPHIADQADVLGHRQHGIMCYDELENLHFTSKEAIQKMNSKFFQLAINRKHRPRNRSNSFTKNLTFVPTIDEKSKNIVDHKYKDRYKGQS